MIGLALVGLLLGVFLDGSVSAAQAPSEESRAYTSVIRTGIEALVADNYPAAMDAFGQAQEMNSRRAAGFCHMGDAYFLQSRMEDALSQFQQCARVARQSNEPRYEARGLVGLVRVHVASQRYTHAREAVRALVQFAEAHVEVVVPSMPQDTLRSLQRIIELDAASAEVKRRREARAAENNTAS